MLLAHVLAERGSRLRGMHVRRPTEPLCSCSTAASRAIFKQAAKAVKRLHDGGDGRKGARVHGDIKLGNFVLTAHGQVKLIDFGFLLDLGTLSRPKVQHHKYSSPQIHILQDLLKGDDADWTLSPQAVIAAAYANPAPRQRVSQECRQAWPAATQQLRKRAKLAAESSSGRVCVKDILKVRPTTPDRAPCKLPWHASLPPHSTWCITSALISTLRQFAPY
jgi:serine/threonine protein kinase